MTQDFLTVLLLFIVVLGLMFVLAPFAPLIVALILVVVGILAAISVLAVAYYLRAVLIRLGIVGVPLCGLWWAVGHMNTDTATLPSVLAGSASIPTELMTVVMLVAAVVIALVFFYPMISTSPSRTTGTTRSTRAPRDTSDTSVNAGSTSIRDYSGVDVVVEDDI